MVNVTSKQYYGGNNKFKQLSYVQWKDLSRNTWGFYPYKAEVNF